MPGSGALVAPAAGGPAAGAPLVWIYASYDIHITVFFQLGYRVGELADLAGASACEVEALCSTVCDYGASWNLIVLAGFRAASSSCVGSQAPSSSL